MLKFMKRSHISKIIVEKHFSYPIKPIYSHFFFSNKLSSSNTQSASLMIMFQTSLLKHEETSVMHFIKRRNS